PAPSAFRGSKSGITRAEFRRGNEKVCLARYGSNDAALILSPCMGKGCERPLRRDSEHDLRQKLLALLLRAVALHGRGEALENAVLERRDDGVMHITLAADRGRVGELVGGGADRLPHLAL